VSIELLQNKLFNIIQLLCTKSNRIPITINVCYNYSKTGLLGKVGNLILRIIQSTPLVAAVCQIGWESRIVIKK
jgi:hypothetical protein